MGGNGAGKNRGMKSRREGKEFLFPEFDRAVGSTRGEESTKSRIGPIEGENGSVVSAGEEERSGRVGGRADANGMVEGTGGEEGRIEIVGKGGEVILVERCGHCAHRAS